MPLTESQLKHHLQQLFSLQLNPAQDQNQLRMKFRQLASDNYEHAQLIVDLFVKQQQVISQRDGPEQLIDMMHAIIKDVQGAYVRCFQSKIRFLFTQIWQRSNKQLKRAEEH